MVRAACAMRGCKSSGIINKELKFHQFPRTENRCKSWVETCKRSDLFGRTCDSLRNTYICSLHFDKKMYGKKSLKKTAVPTLLLPPNESTSTQTDPMDTTLNDIDLDSPDLKTAQKRNESAGPSSRMADYIGETAVKDSRWRNGYRCSSCERLIISKFRYACVQCPNFDLCSACEARGEHAPHYVLRIPPCRPFEEIDAVLRKIRGELSLTTTNIVIKLEVEPQQAEMDPSATKPTDTCNLDALRKIKTEELEVITQEHELPPVGLDEIPSWATDHILPDLPARKPACAYNERPDTTTSKTQDLPHRPQNYTSMAVLPIKHETLNDFPTNLPGTPQTDTSITDVPIKQEIEIDIPLELKEPSTDNQVIPGRKRKGESLKTLHVEAKLEGERRNTMPMSDGRSLEEYTRAAKKKKV